MRRTARHRLAAQGLIGAGITLSALCLPAAQQAGTAASSEPGRTEALLTLPAGNRPEGIVLTRNGTLFLGNRVIGAETIVNEILQVTPAGAVVFATLPESTPQSQGLLGLTAAPNGILYAALASFDANHGVWRISRDGHRIQRVPGSEAIPFPNGLTFDADGRLYVTDSLRGAIWRALPGEPFSPWLEHSLLAPLPTDPFGSPLPGANGIAFGPNHTLFVANTERGQIVSIEVEPAGSPGALREVTTPFSVPAVDGIAVDARGGLHAVLPGYAILGLSPVMTIDPETGVVAPTVIEPRDREQFDAPTSLAFGTGRWDARTVLVVNADLQIAPGGPGPGIVRVDVGVPGFPIP